VSVRVVANKKETTTMNNALDHFDTDLQCEDAAFVEMFETAASALDHEPQEEDVYARDFINSQEEQDEFNEMDKERRKEEYRAQLDTNNTGDEPNWRDYV
jgi:hypothetical protein